MRSAGAAQVGRELTTGCPGKRLISWRLLHARTSTGTTARTSAVSNAAAVSFSPSRWLVEVHAQLSPCADGVSPGRERSRGVGDHQRSAHATCSNVRHAVD